MSSKHRRTLEAVFAKPVLANILWSDVESMLRHFGADIRERAGSRIIVYLRGETIMFHRPHPRKEAKRSTVRNLRAFLSKAGIRP
jgi:hypothetical protein